MTSFEAHAKENPFANIVGKGENAGIQHFLLFSQCFLPKKKTFLPKEKTHFFEYHLVCHLQMLSGQG